MEGTSRSLLTIIALLLSFIPSQTSAYREVGKGKWCMMPCPSRMLLVTFCSLLVLLYSSRCESSDAVQVLTSDEEMIRFRVRTTLLHGETEKTEYGEMTKIDVGGFDPLLQPGYPMVPVTGAWIVVPDMKTWRVEIEPSSPRRISDIVVAPAPCYDWKEGEGGLVSTVEKSFCVDESAYSMHGPYPKEFAEVTREGRLRGNSLIFLEIHPVRALSLSKTVEWSEEMEVVVRFVEEGARGPGTRETEGPVEPLPKCFRDVLTRSVLNKEVLESDNRQEGDFKDTTKGTQGPWLGASASAGFTKVKMEVSDDGLYSLERGLLEASGVPVQALDPRDLRIEQSDREIPILVEGEEDGRFDEGDRVIFLGESNRGSFSDANVYWLTWNSTPGKRMRVQGGEVRGEQPAAERFLCRRTYEKNQIYFPAPYQGGAMDHWYWESIVCSQTLDIDFETNGVATTEGDAEVAVNIFGASYIRDVDPDHHLVYSLNGTRLGEVWWDGQMERTDSFRFSQTLLQEGNNLLQVASPCDTGATVELSLLNRIEVLFWREFIASEDLLTFNSDPMVGNRPQAFRVSGFEQEDVYVFDTTHPEDPVRIRPISVYPEGGRYTVHLEHPDPAGRTFSAASLGAMRQPSRIVLREPTELLRPENQADYIIITHSDFVHDLLPLAERRTEAGLKVRIVDVEDIYDAFSYGALDPRAIKDFLRYTYFNWARPRPTYVLLVGDGTHDYHNYLGSSMNYVPTYLVQTPYNGDTASDNWFACVDGEDPLPDMLIGRLPVSKSDELTAIVNKILEYERTNELMAWSRTLTMVVDDGFETDASLLAETCLEPLQLKWVRLTDYPDPGTDPDPVRQGIVKQINAGTGLVTLVGHGGIDVWTHEYVFTYSDIELLENRDKSFFFLGLTCYNGFFDHAFTDDIMVQGFNDRSVGGAIGSITTTRASSGIENLIFGQGFYEALVQNDIRDTGGLLLSSKLHLFQANTSFPHGIEMFTLFGDPALSLRIPSIGDTDLSGRVDGIDLILLSLAQGSLAGSESYNPSADINRDGIVDQADLDLLVGHLGRRVQ